MKYLFRYNLCHRMRSILFFLNRDFEYFYHARYGACYSFNMAHNASRVLIQPGVGPGTGRNSLVVYLHRVSAYHSEKRVMFLIFKTSN